MDRRDRYASRDGETGELIAARDAFRNGTPAQKVEARAWFVTYEARTADKRNETRVAPTAPRALTEDEEIERRLRDALASVERSNAFDEEFGL